MNQGRAGPAFLFLSANTPWVYLLAQNLSAHAAVTAVRFYDWSNYRRLKPQWPETASAVHRVQLVMPQGYAGTLEPLFRPLMRRLVDWQRLRLRRTTGAEPAVVCPYPYLAPWVRHIPGERIVYYNLDDYALYDPARAVRTAALEDELVQRAALTVCLSVHQTEALRRRHPAHAARIQHFPLGVGDDYLNPAPHEAPIPRSVGYIGNMTDRVDWELVARVAEAMPDTTFYFVGSTADAAIGKTAVAVAHWRADRERALGMSNVIHEGPVPQAKVREHYWRYAVNWMPYRMDHPFNIASCPTKIMDAFASGRPFVTTAVPEARLYGERLHIVETAPQAQERLRGLLSSAIAHDGDAQIAFAATQTWRQRAMRFRELLSRTSTNAQQSSNESVMPT